MSDVVRTSGVWCAPVAPPVAPSDVVRDDTGGCVSGGEVWTRYYDEYARYAVGVKEWFGLVSSCAGCQSSVGALDGATWEGWTRCGRDVGRTIETGLGSGGSCSQCVVEKVAEVSSSGVGSCEHTLLGGVASRGGKSDTAESSSVGTRREGGGEQSSSSSSFVEGLRNQSDDARRDAVETKYVPPARRGPKGGLSVGRGPNYDKNQAARQRKKEVRGFRGIGQAVRMPTFDACDQSVRDELQRTRANRLVVENKLRTVKMEQELEVARSRDVQQMIQQQRTQLLRQTELNRVQIEKAHGSLSGEVAGSVPIVPTVVGGTVETVLTGGSISPSSSISEAEIRKLHKDFLDGQARIAKLEKDNYKLRFGVHQEDSEGGPDDGALWDGGEDSVSQDQFSYRSGYMCTPEQREENKKLALELRGW